MQISLVQECFSEWVQIRQLLSIVYSEHIQYSALETYSVHLSSDFIYNFEHVCTTLADVILTSFSLSLNCFLPRFKG